MKNKSGTYNIRPAAKIIHTLGRDLVGDVYAALVELVKNSYDADASKVDIVFEFKELKSNKLKTGSTKGELFDNPVFELFITIKDNGHGMSFTTITNKWLVPGTDDKLIRKISPKNKRQLQGRKGIGRFAASMLGQEMTLQSTDEEGEMSTIVVDWSLFNSNDYLESVELLVETQKVEERAGTSIVIRAVDEDLDKKVSSWDKKTIEKLINELRRLISPFKDIEKDKFEINLAFKNCPIVEFNNIEFEIETYPIIDLYDYRISGKVDENGSANLTFENNILQTKQVEKINKVFSLEGGGQYCGVIEFDYRVFDREPDAIVNLINKGLIDPVSEEFVSKSEAKRMLNDAYGVNIYKNQFRIRPYGNGGIDWLDLDKRRIQTFALRLSNNQVIGFITIQSEEFSHLEEKSARDGLKENEYYLGLKELAQKVLNELEIRRLTFRENSNKSRGKRKSINQSVKDLFSFNNLSEQIEKSLNDYGVNQENIEKVKTILKAEEQSKSDILEDIQKTIAIYQGQATLGKIITFILHEGRKPIQFFNTEAKTIERYVKHFKKTSNVEFLIKELDESVDGLKFNSKSLSDLFKRVSPLASPRKANRTDFFVKETIFNSYKIFREALVENGIKFCLTCENDVQVYGWKEDLFAIITNLLENSLYWLGLSKQDKKNIVISVTDLDDFVKINYSDDGPGLDDFEIESDVVFEPGYTKKINGTGLGLAIAGEAAERLNGKLSAIKSKNGAVFQIEIKK